MRLSKILKSSAFRLSLVYLVLFGVSVMALLAFMYWTSAGFMAQQTEETIQAEITGLEEQYRQNGLAGVTKVVRERSRNQRFSLYLLTDKDRTPLAGNLDAWPPVPTGAEGWLDFEYERPVGGRTETHNAQARHLLLLGGFELLVGRDVHERRLIERRIQQSLGWAIALTVGLGLIGGVVMSRNMLHRIDVINRTSRDIMGGNLGRRIPVTGTGDEMDRLAQNLNAMLDQIERLMTGMREVTDNIAHDLRSPLNRLRSRLELTLLQPASVDAYRDALEATINEAEGLLKTFNALLSIARAESGTECEDMADLDLGAVVGGVAELYEPAAEQKGIRLAFDAEPQLTVRGDRDLLSQALANLADNALKYTPTGGDVALTARRGANGPEVAVTDSGPGIADKDRERVFDRFVRLEASRNQPGSGLGLSLVRAVARLHGAGLSLEDNGPGLRAVIRFAEIA